MYRQIAQHRVDSNKRDDPTRPLNLRPKGEVGICIDVYDAESLNPQEYGSRRFLLLSLMDSLFEHLSQLSLDIIKGGFERKHALEGVIFQKVYNGIILSVGFESIDAHDAFWAHYRAGLLEQQLQQFIVTDSLKKKLQVKSLQLRARCFKDEEEDCRNEITDGDTIKTTFREKGNHKAMIHKVREFQRERLYDVTAASKDGLRIFDENLSHMLMVLKRNISQDTESIDSLRQLVQLIKVIRDRRNVEIDSLEQYVKFHKKLDKHLAIMEENICHPLAQIPSSCETPAQSELKASMAEKCWRGREMLRTDFDLSTTRNVDWLCKILSKERDLFGGVVSVVAICTEFITDTDQQLDEYLAAVPVDL